MIQKNIKSKSIMKIQGQVNENHNIIQKLSWKKIVLSSLSSIFLMGFNANAGLFTSNEQDVINDISYYQKPINELLDQLKPANIPNPIGVYANTQFLKGNKDDSDVVLLYLEGYIKPMQIKMEQIAPSLELSTESKDKIKTLPLLMKGHMIELRQAIKEQKVDFQAREVSEVQETLADFLKIASEKYEVKPYIPIRPLSDAELFGPLGCEFWVRKELKEVINALLWNNLIYINI